MGRRAHPRTVQFTHYTLSQIEHHFSPALDPDVLAKPSSGDLSRDRIYPLARVFWSWIWQVLQPNASCREVVQQLDALFSLHGRRPISDGTSAYCQARAKIHIPMLDKALESSARSAQRKAKPPVRLRQRAIRIVDGTAIRLADTPANRKAYPLVANQFKTPGFPLLKLVGLFCPSSGALLGHATGTVAHSELRLLLGLKDSLNTGDILVGDRAYGCYVIAASIRNQGCDLVARLNNRTRTVDFRRAKRRLGPSDAVFVWAKPKAWPSPMTTPEQWDALPEELEVRILRRRIERPGFRTREICVVTTLLDPVAYPADEIMETYQQRWRMEMCLDDLKTSLGMENLRGRTPGMVARELRVFLCAHNLLRWVMATAAQAGDVDLERISFTGTLDGLRQWTSAMAMAKGSGRKKQVRELWRRLLVSLAGGLVPLRPGRQEPRAVKKRSKYPRLTRPRGQYVERWSRNRRRRASRAKQANRA
jgi:hypothetical protein